MKQKLKPSIKDYIELCSNKNEGFIAFSIGIMVGLIITLVIQPPHNETIISSFIVSMLITIFCWYGNKILSYWHNTIMPWNEAPLKKAFYVFLLNGGFTAVVIATFLYIFYQLSYSFDAAYLRIAMKWGLIVGVLTSLFLNTFYTGVYFFEAWKTSLLETERLKKANIQSQLHSLRNQVNPHFLFNSFNTLTALIDENKDNAIQYVRNLADLYRYMLKSEQQELSTLDDELKITNLYLDLQKERFGDNLNMSIQVETSVLNKQIPTLTLQILIENCIKHNIIATHKPLAITIKNKGDDHLMIINNLQLKSLTSPSTKLGLDNIQKRYAYLNNSAIEISSNDLEFKVTIPLINAVLT